MIGRPSFLDRTIRFFLAQKLVVILLVLLVALAGAAVAPFDWRLEWLPRRPVPVDAIPNLGENQQIVFTEWPGRSPQDVEDQVTYPLTVALLGVPGVRDVRSLSSFGFSMIFLIFDEGVEFYWSRARILEKLNSLPGGLLPDDTQPALGPDATALGQIFWYSLEGRDPGGAPAGGWDLHELRTVQDWYVRYGLLAAEGISEVASIGGFVQEYQIDVNPDAMRAYGVTLDQVYGAVAKSNLDVGARVTEINRIEYILRGVGFVTGLHDLEEAVVAVGADRVPIRVRDVAVTALGPAERRGVLTQGGAEAVGGVVVVREGSNPLTAIRHVKERIAEISPGLPAKAVVDWRRTTLAEVEAFARAEGLGAVSGGAAAALDQSAWLAWLRARPPETWPPWVTVSQLQIVPFYDRTGLIHETLGTLNDALLQQILVTVIVVIVMVLHLRSAVIISAMLPLAVCICFLCMKLFAVDSNIVSLAGIAIAIGTIVDMGIIVTENVLKHLKEAPADEPRLEVVYRAAREVGSAVLTAISTTVISFLAVFTMTGAEGKMFTPLAFTKTFVLMGSVVAALTVVPAALHVLVAGRLDWRRWRRWLLSGLGLAAMAAVALGLARQWTGVWIAGLLLLAVVIVHLVRDRLPERPRVALDRFDGALAAVTRIAPWVASFLAVLAVGWVLTVVWEPLGPERGFGRNAVFVTLLVGGLLGLFFVFQYVYAPILRFGLNHKFLFLAFPTVLVLLGATVWLGVDRTFGFVSAAARHVGLRPETLRASAPWSWAAHEFPGLGREFMPPLDEGSFLWMPTTMPHASIGEGLEVLRHQDMAIAALPEVESVTGKLGRAESALDPAPTTMIETLIAYKPEYATDEAGRRINFRYDRTRGQFARDEEGRLIPDPDGRPFRQWRDHIHSPQDIWEEIVRAAQIPGTTSAPKLQPIETRLVMLQTGMRAAMGIKLRAPDLATLERMAVALEGLVRQVPAVDPATVNAERVVGKPYFEIEIDRAAISRYGLNIVDVQEVIGVALGGRTITTTVEGRERFPVRVRYPRELRDDPESIRRVLLTAMDGTPIPLGEVAEIRFTRGPEMIRSEDTFLTAYITFGPRPGLPEVEVVEQVRNFLDGKVRGGELVVPPGVSWRFAGNYEHQLRAARTLAVILPVSLLLIFLILYFQFNSVATTLIVFSGIAVAWAGGFTMIYFYGQEWFANFEIFGVNMRALFQLHAINLSVAVWVGFLALFGIATDDGVVIATYLTQSFEKRRTETVAQLRAATVAAGLRRVRPCLMTSATTILALLPVLTATGRGADIMIPMAIPSLGGMSLVMLTMFTVPVLFCLVEEIKLKLRVGAYRDLGPEAGR
jgi:Cu(I)/Ag(I) efflux system membrane protein CusA/SilA